MGEPLAELLAEMLPQVDEQELPFCESAQFTPLLLTSLVTVAVKFCFPFTATFAKVGVIEIEIPSTVMVAEADWLVSAAAAAVSVTVAGFGTLLGAV